MQIIKYISDLDTVLAEFRKQGKPIGFVPTMGALHDGHLSLINQSVSDNPVTVASIYVNPTQFNDQTDLKNYPRNPGTDRKLLESVKCNILFVPDDKEMYPEKDNRVFDFGFLDEIMEGEKRPGHFNGVAQIVTKLFDAVKPDRAYFGKKDFQQIAIIKKIVGDLNYDIEIIACPIVREKDGLAMSSRNTLLKEQERKEAVKIYETLQQIQKRIKYTDIDELKKYALKAINHTKHLKLDYLQIVNTKTLIPVNKITKKEPVTACIAVYAGNIRLIDNLDLFT
ncbi:MAG: pantoate--beta-alanine ligase [Bacteroidales bacterium]|nr:pantoate--beta-alanine ligase [Bacteroidales bacterium]